jgi:hypothetical protein
MKISAIIFIYYYLFLCLYLYLFVALISLFIVEYIVNSTYYIIFGVDLSNFQKIHMSLFICYSFFIIIIINFLFNEKTIENV